jgi:ABC-2 type transport system permease protein
MGYVKLQVISAGLIFIAPFVFSLIIKSLGSDVLTLAFIADISIWVIAFIVISISIISVAIGVIVSSLILRGKEF